MIGSSPLARGLPQEVDGETRENRIIPARAGFTWIGHVTLTARMDHPRSRGVYGHGGRYFKSPHGSSPLARGLLNIADVLLLAHRIIPARAGFTGLLMYLRHGPGDHPRSRGVYPRNRNPPQICQGSSPLARGLHGQGVGHAVEARIIPARAGFTNRPSTYHSP